MPETQSRRSEVLSTIALLCIVALAVLGVTLVALLFIGWFALAIPVVAASAVYLYRLTIRSATSYEGRVVAREVGAGVLAIAAGFGAWISTVVVGVWTQVLPLDSGSEDYPMFENYPYADAWTAGGAVLAILVVPGTWWLLRRFAGPENPKARRVT